MTSLVLPTPTTEAPITVDEFADYLNAGHAFAFDVEHAASTAVHKPDFDIWGVSFAIADHVWFERDKAKAKQFLQRAIPLEVDSVAYNFKYDLKCCKRIDLIGRRQNMRQACDPMVGVNLLDDNRHPNKLSLEQVVKDVWGHQMDTYTEASVGGPDSYRFVKYTCEDAAYELALWNRIKPKLESERLLNLFRKILMRVLPAFADLELKGFKWDLKYARWAMGEFMAAAAKAEQEIYAEIGQLNLNSGDQIARRLFDELGYDTRGVPMTKGGKNKAPRYATGVEVMDALAPRYPVCNLIRIVRTATKMNGTYLEPCSRKAMEDPDQRLHPTIWLTSTTGRTRADSPNSQNFPAYWDSLMAGHFGHIKIRDAIVSAPGRKFVVADQSQIELRVCAHVSGDKQFLKAYQVWQCSACGSQGTEEKKLLHSCPKCGAAENEDLLVRCPRCKRQGVKVDKKRKGCPVCLDGVKWEDALVRAFYHGEDLHQMTTDAVPALNGNRQFGKACNFALIYCATAMRMHYEHTSLSVSQWEDIIQQYFRRYMGVKAWHIRTEQNLRESGIIVDCWGRKRRIPRYQIETNFKHCLNMACNFPVQAPACELLEYCLANIYEETLASGEWGTKMDLVNWVHDELVFEVDEDFIEPACDIIRRHTEVELFRVPIRMGFQVVDTYGSAK